MNSVDLANNARKDVLRMTHHAKASHVGSCFSVMDILAVLYAGGFNLNLSSLRNFDRDLLILSKGHSAAAIYAILANLSYFPKAWLSDYCKDGAKLGGHVSAHDIPGIELSTGSLGHGLPYGAGLALSRKLANLSGRIYVVMSDGECDEGTTWESALFANHHNLSNLTVIIDRNMLQSLTTTEDTLALEPLGDKWISFGWSVLFVDGHDHKKLENVLKSPATKPTCIIAQTVKGFPVSFMENQVPWHYKSPNLEELNEALAILEAIKP
jgi:transketolase